VCSTAAISQKNYSFDDFGKLGIKTHGVESSMIGLRNRHGVGIFLSSNQFSRFRVLMIVMTLCQPCSLFHILTNLFSRPALFSRRLRSSLSPYSQHPGDHSHRL